MSGLEPPEAADLDLPEAAWWVAVASLTDVGPARLAALQQAWPGAEAWRQLCAGTAHHDRGVAERLGPRWEATTAGWQHEARACSVPDLWQRHLDAGVVVSLPGSPTMPEAFVTDLHPPGILFSAGDLARLHGPRVGVVGTRRASRYGREVAYELGLELARAGVRVVSGLALGIDGAAHRGALAAADAGPAAPPIGIVASGLDTCYPPAHGELWQRVADQGVLLTEAPLGTRPNRWRFPARNRLIAALSDLVVVVESPATGGALLTADEAIGRGRQVFAVPGSVRSPSAVGVHDLLADGALVCRDVGDLLVGLGLESATQRGQRGGRDRRPPPAPVEQQVLDAIGWQPTTLEQLAVRTDLPLTELSAAIARLETAGWVAADGGWFEQVAVRVTA